MTNSSTPLWVVTAEFTERDDAVALIDLARELGIVAQLSTRSINERNNSPMRETRLGKLILSMFQPGRSYELEHFGGLLEEKGYKATSAAPALSRLVEQGDVERLGAGVYRLSPQPGSFTRVCPGTTRACMASNTHMCDGGCLWKDPALRRG